MTSDNPETMSRASRRKASDLRRVGPSERIARRRNESADDFSELDRLDEVTGAGTGEKLRLGVSARKNSPQVVHVHHHHAPKQQTRGEGSTNHGILGLLMMVVSIGLAWFALTNVGNGIASALCGEEQLINPLELSLLAASGAGLATIAAIGFSGASFVSGKGEILGLLTIALYCLPFLLMIGQLFGIDLIGPLVAAIPSGGESGEPVSC